MSGLYDRMVGDDHVATHMLTAVIVQYNVGTYTASQLRDGVNSTLQTALDAAAESDITNILAVLNGKANLAAKLAYIMTVESVNTAREHGLNVPEATWRGILEI